MPVTIGPIEDMTEEEFARLQRDKRARTANPMMEELLDRVESGRPQRVPLGEDQSARGLRVSIARAAGRRGLSVETVEGNGFVAVRRADRPSPAKPKRQPAADGRRRRGRTHEPAAGTEPDPDDLSETME